MKQTKTMHKMLRLARKVLPHINFECVEIIPLKEMPKLDNWEESSALGTFNFKEKKIYLASSYPNESLEKSLDIILHEIAHLIDHYSPHSDYSLDNEGHGESFEANVNGLREMFTYNHNKLLAEQEIKDESKTVHNETINLLAEISSGDVLSYYGIHLLNKNSLLSIVTEKLSLLYTSKSDKPVKRKEFNIIKEELLENVKIIQEFISLYGESLDIEDTDDFEDEFVFKELEKIVKVMQK